MAASSPIGFSLPPASRKRLNEEERVRRVEREVLRRAGAARANPRSFFSFVIREETTQERVQCLAFQTVVYKFVEHFDRCVIRMPVGFSKTFTMSALSMYLIGNDVTTRGAIISASQGQAQKPVSMVRGYIENSLELKATFPNLRKPVREGDAWTQNRITVSRPYGIRDASLTAVGYHGKLPGARLNWILVDDILTDENTATAEQRDAVNRWFNSTVLGRRDIKGTKIVVTNTPWHPEDITYRLEKAGWPALTVDIEGNIYFTNTCEEDCLEGVPIPYEGEFDCDDIRPSMVDDKAHRLTAHDDPIYNPDLAHLPIEERRAAQPEGYVDEFDVVPLWPERYGRKEIEKLKHDYRAAMHEYNQLYMCRCRDDESSRVKVAWIEECKKEAREQHIFTFTGQWNEPHPTFTGVDLGVGKKQTNDRTSIFTFAVLPDKHRRILRIDSGRWDGSVIIDLISEHYERFNSIIGVETNAAQDFLRQWARERNRHLPLRAMPTGKNKLSRQHGVESIFIEISNGAWLIPNDHQGGVTEPVQRWINSMLYYNPDKHTGDELMACWIARELARKCGALRRGAKDSPEKGVGAGVGAR